MITEIKTALRSQVLAVCEYLIPGGKVKSGEYCTGNLNGDPGQSLRVCLRGRKSGVWSDFATGEKGDLIDLWCMTNNQTLREALPDIREYLGMKEWGNPQKTYNKPKPISPAPSPYLVSRGIPQEIQAKYRISETHGVLHFPYYEGHEIVFVKHLKTQRNGKKEMWTDGGCKPICFGWQAIDPNLRKIFITEGEIDAMSLAVFGLPAVSVPVGAGGGGDWIQNDWERLSCFEIIYICFDNDPEGQKGAGKLADRLGLDRCKIVHLPANDANECLTKGIGIKKAVTSAKHIDLETLTHVSEIRVTPPNTTGFVPEWEKAKSRIRFRYGELTIWTGINGHGKTNILNHLILMALKQDEHCGIASLETRPSTLLSRITRQACGDVSDLPLWLFVPNRGKREIELIKAINYGRKRYGITQFVIDSLMKCGFAEDDYSGQKLFVEALCDLAMGLNIHIHLVAHARKREKETQKLDKMDVKGTGAITDLAFNVISIWRNKKKERTIENNSTSMITEPDAMLTVHKQREGDWEGSLKLWFDNYTYQFWDDQMHKPKIYGGENDRLSG